MAVIVVGSDRQTKYSFADLDNFLKTECPDDYAALPHSTDYKFSDWTYTTDSTPFAIPIVNVLLHVGTSPSGKEVRAYLTDNSVEFNIGSSGIGSVGSLDISNFKKPFCYLGSFFIDSYKLKALVQFIFLSAGYVSEVSRLSTTDLRRACAWVQSKGSKPLSITEKRKRKLQAYEKELRESTNAGSGGQLVSSPSTDAATLAGRDLALQPTPKRTKFNDAFDRMEQRTRQNDAEVAELRKELASLEQQNTAVTQLQDEVKSQHGDIRQLREQLQRKRDCLATSRDLLIKAKKAQTEDTATIKRLEKQVEDLQKEKATEHSSRTKAESRLKEYVDAQTKMLASYKSG